MNSKGKVRRELPDPRRPDYLLGMLTVKNSSVCDFPGYITLARVYFLWASAACPQNSTAISQGELLPS